jgi:hypothetical protein
MQHRDIRGQFFKRISRQKENLSPTLGLAQLAPRREVGAFPSFKKHASVVFLGRKFVQIISGRKFIQNLRRKFSTKFEDVNLSKILSAEMEFIKSIPGQSRPRQAPAPSAPQPSSAPTSRGPERDRDQAGVEFYYHNFRRFLTNFGEKVGVLSKANDLIII